MNIVDIAAGSDDFNILVRALQTVDLVDTVRDATDVTVFAPTDAAFTQLANDLGYDGDAADEDAVFAFLVSALTDLGGGDPAPVLTDILLYHVSAGAKSEAEIEAAGSVATLLTGVEITPDGDDLGDKEPDIPNPSIVAPDIAASNGTIQGIDRVLLPLDIPGNDRSSITEIVAASGQGFDENATDFDILLSAVSAAGLADPLATANADLTVFAPTDGAFVGLAQDLGYQGADEKGSWAFIQKAVTLLSKGGDPLPLLTDILTYHVVPGARDATEVLSTSSLQTLQGGSLSVNGTTLVDNDPDLPNPNILGTNIYASNGIIHAIDGVLLPTDILQSDGSDAVDFLIGDDTSEVFDLGADNDWVYAGGGDDTVSGGQGSDVILGGKGIDRAVMQGNSEDYGLQISADGIAVINKASAGSETDFLKDVELMELSDGFAFLKEDAVDLEALSGSANLSGDQLETLVELYVAYFNRAPDALGILFWGNALEEGVPLAEIAELFFDQPEAHNKLPPETDAGAFVDLAYAHLLERSADDAGRSFWVEQLETGHVTRAEFMLELIAGARANSDAAEDIRTIEDKTDIGISYALIEGLTSATNASTVLDAYDRDDASASLAAAQQLIEGFAADANGAGGSSELTIQLVGVIDDPFSM
jgi:uncharacterized surface protein with fasciclin (FAS1) repeats